MPKNKKIISVLLIIFLMFSVLPDKVYGKSGNDKNTNVSKVQNITKNKKKKVGKIVKELSEGRTKDSKKFEKDDGTYEIAQYKTPVHYLDNGKWKDIDNTLEEKNEKDDRGNSNTYLQNKQNDFKVKIAKNSSAQKLMEVEKDKYNVSWNLADVASTGAVLPVKDEDKINIEINKTVDDEIKKDAELKEATAKDKDETKKTLSSNEKTKTLKSITSTVKFSNIYKDVDLQYVINGSDVKENILINKSIDNAAFNFNLNANNLIPVLQQDKSIIFYDLNDKSKAVFKIQAPFMYDKAGNTSENIDIKLNKTKDVYVLSVVPDKAWLDSSDRVYPITVDPSMQTSLAVNSIHDTFVASIDSSNKWNNQFVRTGQVPSNVGLTRTYIKFDLPQLSTGDMITNAQLNLAYCASASNNPGNQVNVHKVNQNFDPKNINWGSQPSYDSRVEDFALVNNPGQDKWTSWDITAIAKQWFTNGNNYGLMLEQDSGGGYSSFWSSDISSGYEWARPQVSFSYVNNTGLEDYWTYHSQEVGRAGTSYVNDYNGNLIFTHGDISMSGSRMPVSINHVFNSNDRTSNIGYGTGWRLNISQRVELQTISGVQYYKYTDEDGTKHYFKNSSAAQINDELNLGLTLIKESDGTITIKDKDDSKINFNSGTNDLKYMKDANGNTMTFTYGGTSCNGIRNLTKVTDGAGRSTTLTYVASGILTTIVDPAGRVTGYNYDGNGNLTSITYSDGKTSTYSYDGNHNLTKAVNYDGYKMSYEYYGIVPYRVSHILESNNDGTLGNDLRVNYGNNSTTFTDVKGRNNTYQFDNFGKTLCVKDSDGSAQYYEYGDTTNNTKLTTESKLQKTVVNLLTNHDVETNDSWGGGADGGKGTSDFSTEASYLGNRSLKVTKTDNVSRQYMNEWVALQKGKTYTFSAYVKTVNISNTNGQGATINAYYRDKTGSMQMIESKPINGTKDWQRVEVTFTVPGDSTDPTVCLRDNLLQETGTAYFDSMQLEEGSISNRYNLIDRGDLTGGGTVPDRWSSSNGNLVNINDSDHPGNLDNKVFQVTGARGVEKRLSQSVQVSGKAGDVYSIGSWAKGYSVPAGTFQIQAALINSSGAQWATFDFNKASNDWQYVSGKFIANSDYSRIDIYYLYGNNANTAYFDGAQLYKEEFGQSYQYDSKGNVSSTASIAKQNSDFQYNSKNDLIKTVDPKGNSFNYTYDDKHNITKAISAESINYNFTYDSYGNPTSAKIGDDSKYIKTNSSYTSSGNYIKSLTDSLGNTVNYNYDETKGLLTSSTDPKGSTTNNNYDAMDRLTSVSKNVSGKQITNNYSYQNDNISQITHNGFSYNFAYDSLGNNTKVSVGSQNLITNTYEPKTSVLLKSNYGNGQELSNSYDSLDRITAKKFNGNTRYTYEYDASDNLAFHKDLVNGVDYRYIYDTSDRLVSTKDSNGNYFNYQYDLNNNISSVIDNVDKQGFITNYGYDRDNKQTQVSYSRTNNNSELFPLNGTDYGTKGTKPITSPINTGITATAEVKNVTSEGYDVVATVNSAKGGVKRVMFPTWTENNGQDDTIWSSPTSVSGDTYTYHVNRSEHKNEYGKYNTHVYVDDNAGNTKVVGLTANLVNTPIALTAEIKNADSNGYDVVATVTSVPGGFKNIDFPTWTENNGQDDIIWGKPISISGNTYTYHVNRSDHKNEYGKYNTHVYLYDNSGKCAAVATSATLNTAALGVSANITNITSNGYDVVAKVTSGNTPIDRVQFPTWTSHNNQDDMINPWPTATSVSGNTYTYHVNRSDHKNEYGEYNTHVYVYDKAGTCSAMTLSTTINAPVNGIDMTTDDGKTVMMADGVSKAVYNLGLNKNAGTMGVRFKTNTSNTKRYVLASQGSNDEGLYLYLSTDNKLKAAVRNNAGNMVDVASTAETVSVNQWYFTAVNWQFQNGTLNITMYLNDKAYTAKSTDFKDFTGANTSVGASITNNLPLKGVMEQFTYAPTVMSSTDIKNISSGATNNTIKYSYDNLGRLNNESINTGTATKTVSYSYLPGTAGAGATTAKIGTIDNSGSKISYTYDANGNIQTITENGKTKKYTYNELNEVTREDNAVLNKTIVYNYDSGGNITSKVEYAYTTGTLGAATKTVNYGYGDSNWKDKLTSYDGKNISYDAIGNPLNDGIYSYTWEEGRQLKSISGNGKSISYKYNDAGIRTQKVVNGVATNYHLEGDKVTYESNGTDKIYYTYDSEDDLISMNLNGTEYYYIRNAQGDIIGLFDKAGTQVVAYTYDTWGKLISTTGTLASTVGAKNPYRYRGYRYDGETGLYYLQSRYYNAEWGRFINADGYIGTPGELLSCNMFAYCSNNPVNRDDPNGEFWGLLAAALFIPVEVAAVVTAVLVVAVVLIVAAVVTVAVQTYRNSHINYADSSSKASSSSKGGSSTPKSSSSGGSSTTSKDTIRVRHYTNRKGLNGIKNDGKIVGSDNNRVYVEPAKKKPLSPQVAEKNYQLAPGKGRDYLETDVPKSLLEWVKNPRYGTKELTVKGRIPLINPKFYPRR
jgi:RHS repeat-associated protein